MKFGHEIKDIETAVRYNRRVFEYFKYLKAQDQNKYIVKNHLGLCNSFIEEFVQKHREMFGISLGMVSLEKEQEFISTINDLVNKYFYTIDLDREFSVD